MIARINGLLTMLRLHAPIRFWAMVGAAVFLTFVVTWEICIVAYGAWPAAQDARRLDILGKALWITLAMVLVIVVSLTSQKLSARGLGGSIDIGGGEDKKEGE